MKSANRCSDTLPLLSPLLDDELTPEAHANVARHVAECAACSARLEGISDGRRLARALPGLDLPAGLSRAIAAGAKAQGNRRQGSVRRLAGGQVWAIGTVAALLVLAVALWPRQLPSSNIPAAPEAQQSSVAAPLHLAQLAADVRARRDFDAIAATYQLRRIDLETALGEASFKVTCPLESSSGDAHVRELRECPLIHLSALRGDQEIVLLQQPAGVPIVYGDQPVQHLTYGGEPCDRLQTDGHELFKWERGGTRWIVVARAGHPEVEKVVSTLVSTS